jgi:protoheme IX farnesyltransferase
MLNCQRGLLSAASTQSFRTAAASPAAPGALPVAPAIPIAAPPFSLARLAADYAELFKLRIGLMIVITAWAGYYLGCLRSGISSFNPQLVLALFGVFLAACGSGALNQAMERVYDARMIRTSHRPMAAGRIGLVHGLLAGLSMVAAGVILLALKTNLITATLSLLTVFLYVAVYTPLKRFTTLATFIGAFPGAMPPLLGWTAARGILEWPAIALFAILFVWQFPHFMAIAWLYREDYARAGIRMLPVVEPDGRSTVTQALVYAVLMVPVSLIPCWLGLAGWTYGTAAALLSAGYLLATVRFANILRARSEFESRRYARDLLKVSVIYLPLLLGALMLSARAPAH